MKMRCIARIVLRGDVVHVGDVLDFTDAEVAADSRIKADFVPVDPSASGRTASQTEPIVAGLTREQAILKLQSMRVTVPPDADDKAVADLFLASVDAKAHRKAK